jgi:serine/threonine-protein kinase
MELVEGEDLAQRLTRGAVPIDEALPIAKQIVEALEAAHEQGIIHRDLKPANVKVALAGRVKVLDFGLAKALEPAAGSSPSMSMSPTITTPAMTQAGMILGTAAYMSPEQARGKSIDKRADIWAFGCVVFEMLTGRRAFDAEDVSLTLAEVMKSEPDWSALPASVSPALRTFLRRCLVKDPRQRLRDIGDVRLALDGAFDTAAEPAAAPAAAVRRALWRRALPAVTSAIVVGGFAGAVVWELRSSPRQVVTRFSYRLPEGQAFQNTGRQAIAISPDGTEILYVAAQRLQLRSLSEAEAKPIPGVEVTLGEGTNPVFSPDGRSIAFRSGVDGTLKKVDVRGGAAVTICPTGPLLGISWDADGILFGETGKGIMRVSPTGGQPELLVSVKNGELAHGPQMLPGRRAVLFTLANGTDADRWDKAKIVVQTLKTGERKTLIEGGSDARYMSTGHLVYALGGTVFAVPFDPGRLQVTGGPVPIVEGVLRAGGNGPSGVAQFSVSSGGTLVYIPGPASTSLGQSSLELIDRKGNVEILKLPPAAYEHPRVSPDGNHLVYTIDDAKDGNIYTYDLSAATQPRRLTFGGRNRFPIWSSDGEHVAFQSDREGDLGIFWQRADGTEQATRLTKPEPGTAHAPESWSPDGKTFLFSVVKDSTVSLWTFSMNDKKAVTFDDVKSSAPTHSTFSPDGRWVAYTVYGGSADLAAVSAGDGIYVQPFPTTGAKYQISFGTGIHPLWSPDGKELVYAPRSSAQMTAVGVKTQPEFAIGNPQPLPRGGLVVIGPQMPRRYDMMRDGRILGIASVSQTQSSLAVTPEIDVVLSWFEELTARVPTK